MKLILSLKRTQLVAHICDDPTLRAHLRRSSRRLLDSDLIVEATAVEFDLRMQRSADPHRFVATALVADANELAAAAVHWALHPDLIPDSPPPALPAPTSARPLAGPQTSARVTSHEADESQELSADSDHSGEFSELKTPVGEPYGPADPFAALIQDREELRRNVARLEAEVLDLRSRVPTRGERRRQGKQLGELKRQTAELDVLREEVVALRSERDHLVRIRHKLEEQLEEAEDARSVALRKSQHLERRLATTEGRASYLRRSVEKDLEAARAVLEALPQGRDRTKAKRRTETLVTLGDALELAFPEESELPVRNRRVAVGRSMDLVVTPIGGGEEIGGSAILIEAAGRRVLIDAGLHPDGRGPAMVAEVLAADRLDALVITHAHNDHAGFVPALVSRFPMVPVYCSYATANLLPTMWSDSANVMDRAFTEAADGAAAAPPLYGKAEVEAAEARIEDRQYHRQFGVGELRLTLFPAGHILGAVGVVVEAGDKRVVVTGDISGLEDRYLSVEPPHLPDGLVSGADLLVIETTYCMEEHRSRHLQEAGIVSAVQSVIDRRGRVLIPAFGLGRAQEIILILSQHLPDVDVLVDGMAKDISAIYERIGEDSGRPLPVLDGRVRSVRNRQREILSFHSGVIVASSGMLTGGASVDWAQSILPDERAALLLCGYQDEEAPGRQLERLANGYDQRRRLSLPDRDLGWIDVEVRSDVRKYALSAHADQRGLVDIITRVRPQNTMLVHGLPTKQAAFRRLLYQRGVHTVPTSQWESCPS